MNTIGYFEIQSSDVKREISFYKAVFGWRCTKEENVLVEYYRIETGSINGGLLQRLAPTPSSGGANAFVCSVQVTNFDETSELILSNGGHVALPKFAVPGRCWQGYFTDAGNNTFGIFEVDQNAR